MLKRRREPLAGSRVANGIHNTAWLTPVEHLIE